MTKNALISASYGKFYLIAKRCNKHLSLTHGSNILYISLEVLTIIVQWGRRPYYTFTSIWPIETRTYWRKRACVTSCFYWRTARAVASKVFTFRKNDEVFFRRIFTCDLQDIHAVFGTDIYDHSNCLSKYLMRCERQAGQ